MYRKKTLLSILKKKSTFTMSVLFCGEIWGLDCLKKFFNIEFILLVGGMPHHTLQIYILTKSTVTSWLLVFWERGHGR